MKILLVEDDLEISKLLAEFLQENGYEVFCQYDGLHVLDCLRENNIDLILLDIMLPYRNGDTVLTAVRECSTVPIIVISAKGTTQNEIDLLRLGADDYITKPFDMEEVLARIESNLRRVQFQKYTPTYLRHGDLILDLNDNTAFLQGRELTLTAKEFAILEFHSRYFWGIVAFNLFLSSVLLLDSIGETSSLFFASLYNVPILFFLAIVFSALFVGNDFGQRTLQSYIIAGHNRGQILLAKLIAYQIACMTILALPLLVHGLIGRLCFKESFVSVSGNLYTVLAVLVSLFAMCLLPFFFAFLFRDIGKTLAVPMVLFFLMIFLMNGDQALFISRILPMGQLRLIALQQFIPSMVQFVFTDFLWIFILYFGAYLGFRHSDLK